VARIEPFLSEDDHVVSRQRPQSVHYLDQRGSNKQAEMHEIFNECNCIKTTTVA